MDEAENKKKKFISLYFFDFSSSEVKLMEDSSVSSEAMNSSILSSSKKPCRRTRLCETCGYTQWVVQTGSTAGSLVAQMILKTEVLLE